MENSGFRYFNESWIFDEQGNDDWRDDWKIYFEILSNWATSSNVTLVKVVGELVPIERNMAFLLFSCKTKSWKKLVSQATIMAVLSTQELNRTGRNIGTVFTMSL